MGGELFEYGVGFELTREELKVIELDEFGGDSKDVSIEDSISCSIFVLFCLTRRRLIPNGALPDTPEIPQKPVISLNMHLE